MHTLLGALRTHLTGDVSSVDVDPRPILAVRAEAADTVVIMVSCTISRSDSLGMNPGSAAS